MKTKHETIPFEATHPGTLIQDEINYRDIKQSDLAMQLDIQKSLLNEIIKGKRAVTADIAILLEKILGISAEYWMNLQSQYDIDIARIKEKNVKRLANAEQWSIIKNYVPLNYLKKRGYFNDDLNKDIEVVKSIYDVPSIDMLVQKTAQQHVALHRKSDKLLVDDKNMLAWNMLAQYESRNQQVNSFNFNNLPALKKELRSIFFENVNTIENVKSKMNQYGIKFVLIEKIEKAPIDGYTFWSDNNPAIAMTIRHKRIDNFAFTIMHELGHIDLHLRINKDSQFFDLSGADKSMEVMEQQADKYAQESLISPIEWQEIQNLPEWNDYSVNLKANEYGIHPAIILGRLSHEINYYAMNTTIDKKLN